MAQDARGGFYEVLEARGVSRRDFLKYCGSVAAMLGMSELMAPQVASAIEKGATLQPALWLAQGLCTGCTESMAQVDTPDVPTIVLDLLSLNYWETVMAAAGDQAEANIKATVEKGGYIAIIEGTIMTGFGGNTLRIAGKPAIEELLEVCSKAAAVIAVGSCAVDGGWVVGNPNPAGGMGTSQFLTEKGVKTPVVNLPTCPVNPEWVVAMVVDVLLLGELADGSILKKLNEKGEPKLIFGQTIHDNCPRRGHFENNEFVEAFGTQAEVDGWCLYKVGCKGPQTFTNCPLVRWNHRYSWCVESGSPCIGCGTATPGQTKGNWVDAGTPFLSRLANVNTTVNPVVVGEVLAAATAAGLVVHGIASVATGRTKGVATEKEKVWDQKHSQDKGGDN
jgi:hydrogenase small subunit